MKKVFQAKSIPDFLKKKQTLIKNTKQQVVESPYLIRNFFANVKDQPLYYLCEYLLSHANENEYLNVLYFLDGCEPLQIKSNPYIQESFQQTTLHYLNILPNSAIWKSSFLKRNIHSSATLINAIQKALVNKDFEENFIGDALKSNSDFVIEYALWLAFRANLLPLSLKQKILDIQGEYFENVQQKISAIYEADLLKIEDLYSSNEMEDYLLSLYHLFGNEHTISWPLVLDEILENSTYKDYFLHLIANVFSCSVNDHTRVPELLKSSDLDIKILGIHKAINNISPAYTEAILENLTKKFLVDPGETFYQNLLYLLFKIGDKQEFTIKVLIDLLNNKKINGKTKRWLMSTIAELGAEYSISFIALQEQSVTRNETSLYALDTLGQLIAKYPKKYTYLLKIFPQAQNRDRLITWILQIKSSDIDFITELLIYDNKELFFFASQRILVLEKIPTVLEQLFLQKLNKFIQIYNGEQIRIILKVVSHHKMSLSDENINNLLLLFMFKINPGDWILYTFAATNSVIAFEKLYLLHDESEKIMTYLLNIKLPILVNDFLRIKNELSPQLQSIVKKNLQNNREYYLDKINNADKHLYTAEHLITCFQMLNAPIELVNAIPNFSVDDQVKAIKALSRLPIVDEVSKIDNILIKHACSLREAYEILSVMATTPQESVTAILQQQICCLLAEKSDMPQDMPNWLLQQNLSVERNQKDSVVHISQKITFEQPEFLDQPLFLAPEFTPEKICPQFTVFASVPYPFLPENKWIQLHEKLNICSLKEPLIFEVDKIRGKLQVEKFFEATGILIRFRRYYTYSYDFEKLPGRENRLEFIAIDIRGEETNTDLENWLENHIDDQIARLGNFFFVIHFYDIENFSYDFTTKLAPEYCLMIAADKKIRQKYSRFTFFDNEEEAFIYGKNSKLSIHDKRSVYDSIKPKPEPESKTDWMKMERERGISAPSLGLPKSTPLGFSEDSKKKSPRKQKPIFKKFASQLKAPSTPPVLPSPPAPPPPPASPSSSAPPPPKAVPSREPFLKMPASGGMAPESIGSMNLSFAGETVVPAQREPQLKKPKPSLGKKENKISRDISQEIELKTEEVSKEQKRARGKKKEELPISSVPVQIDTPPWFEKWLSDDAGHPGPVERLIAQSTTVMKSIQQTIGLRFIMLAHFGDVVIEAITSYVRGVFETWKNYKTMQKRLQMKNVAQQITVIEEDICKAREQFSRAFYLVGYNVYDSSNIESTFALKLVVELRGHLDQMKRDLAFVNAEEIQKNVQNSIIDFFKSFIPNPVEILLPIKDSILIAFFMKYSRSEIEKMYVDMFVSYQILLLCLVEKNNLQNTQTFELQKYEKQLAQNVGQGYTPENTEDIKLCISECREKIQKLIQMSCNCHYLISVKKWSKKDLLLEYKKYQQQEIINPIIFLEMEVWTRKLAQEYIKRKNIKISTQDKQQQIIERKHFMRRYKIAKTLHEQFLQ
ncbi:hypothetical protein [Candidatus Uabimicrobium sp. HlEnr_7]|uniref:hypothetical protein n=1 Tax=Candidatus Uabimicrobium helgolandensis TaxID=3095367 RepID=UPI003557CAF2